MAETSNTLVDKIQDLGNQIGQVASNAAKGVKSATDNATNRASEFMTSASERAEEAGTFMKDRANQATVAFGDKLKAAGEASGQIADNLKSAGSYLETEGLEGMTTDVIALIKKKPLASVLVSLCLGFCLGRTVYMRD